MYIFLHFYNSHLQIIVCILGFMFIFQNYMCFKVLPFIFQPFNL